MREMDEQMVGSRERDEEQFSPLMSHHSSQNLPQITTQLKATTTQATAPEVQLYLCATHLVVA